MHSEGQARTRTRGLLVRQGLAALNSAGWAPPRNPGTHAPGLGHQGLRLALRALGTGARRQDVSSAPGQGRGPSAYEANFQRQSVRGRASATASLPPSPSFGRWLHAALLSGGSSLHSRQIFGGIPWRLQSGVHGFEGIAGTRRHRLQAPCPASATVQNLPPETLRAPGSHWRRRLQGPRPTCRTARPLPREGRAAPPHSGTFCTYD